jgi:hypothetical protein
MKDDTATLTSAGVCTNSVITLNGEKVDVSYTIGETGAAEIDEADQVL